MGCAVRFAQHALLTMVMLLNALGALLAATLLWVPGVASAQDAYPNRPITLVVPFPPGSGTDLSARVHAHELSSALGQPVVVENRPGANGVLGARQVARARPDGYTLLVGSAATNASNYAFFADQLGYSAASFEIVGTMGQVPFVLVVASESPWHSLADLLAEARKHPGKVACGSGVTTAQVACELLKIRAGITVLNVPYKGTPPALTDLAGGHVQFVFADGASATGLIEQKRLRVLAVAARSRAPQWPEVPTLSELGWPDLELSAWSALFVPAGTPAAIQKKLNDAVRIAIRSAESMEFQRRTGSLPLDLNLDDSRQFVASEINRWARFVRESGIRLD